MRFTRGGRNTLNYINGWKASLQDPKNKRYSLGNKPDVWTVPRSHSGLIRPPHPSIILIISRKIARLANINRGY